MVFQFPKQKLVFGPRQIVARINQDQDISPQITLWNQQGSSVIQGTLLVVPIEESLLYIRPLYLQAADGQIPELKRVIVAYQNQIVMEDTLALSLDRLFGQPDPGQRLTSATPATPDAPLAQPSDLTAPSPTPPAAVSALAAEARRHYERAIQAQRAGNWNLYGAELDRLGEILEQMASPTAGLDSLELPQPDTIDFLLPPR